MAPEISDSNSEPSTDLGSPRTNPERTRELLQGALQGDEGAWRLIFAAHHKYLLYILRARTSDAAGIDLEGILQATFLDAWRHIKRFQYRGVGSLRGWLKTIAVNRHADALRRPRNESDPSSSPSQLLAPQATPEQAVSQREEQTRLFRALGRLSELERDLVIMRQLEGLSWEEISELTDGARTSLRRTYVAAVDKLQRWME